MNNQSRANKEGQSLVEYAILIFLVTAVSLGGLQLMRQKVNTNLTSYANNLNGTPTAQPATPTPVNGNTPVSIRPANLAPGTPPPTAVVEPSHSGSNSTPVVTSVITPPAQTTNPPLIASIPVINTPVIPSLPIIAIATPAEPIAPIKNPVTVKPVVTPSGSDTQNTQNAWGTVADMCMGCSTLMTGNYGW